eukprot:CAMPEP_0175145434 /NCGR_PEP_ID=MMETSP0087-20121206/14765_1 /TAXON_ID=136419 /ORGANISM="Unknown Unknown, Strain D1" /LENGTH=336 /DNA_ID=CAMNT_0016430173 /DNA_START=20 /DNA_END=1030 /DNA_ORIENTATION=-
MPSEEHELKDAPTDGVTSNVFANSSDLLMVSSWDKGVRLYDARKNVLKHSYEHQAAVLDCAFTADDAKGFSGGLDRTLMMCDFQTGNTSVLGSHNTAIKCVEYSETTGLVISGGWDSKVCLWDARAQNAAGSTRVQEGLKVYTAALNHNRLVVGTSGRQVYIYDVRQMSQPEQVRESSLMNQTRCIRIFPNGAGYALSSIEGRVAIEFFDPSPIVQKKKYAFKCHRKSGENKVQTLFPVNAIAFHPTHGTFATGGCDGLVNVWDGENKKRICQYREYPTSVAALDFNYTGDLLAISASYTFEEGDKDHPADAVFIRTVNENEVKKKLAKKKQKTEQ